MTPGNGGLSQNDLHPLNVGRHLRRHGKCAGIGIGAGIGPHAQQIVVQGHDRVFQNDGNGPEKEILRKAHIAGKRGLKLLPVDVELHVVPHLRDDLRERVRAESRVDNGADSGNKVPQSF